MISSTNHEIIPVSFQASTIAYPFSPHHFSSIVFVDRLRGRHVIISRRLRLFPDDYFFLEFFVNDPFNSLPFRLLLARYETPCIHVSCFGYEDAIVKLVDRILVYMFIGLSVTLHFVIDTKPY